MSTEKTDVEKRQRAGRVLVALGTAAILVVALGHAFQGRLSLGSFGQSLLSISPLVLIGGSLWVGDRRRTLSIGLTTAALVLAGLNLVNAFR